MAYIHTGDYTGGKSLLPMVLLKLSTLLLDLSLIVYIRKETFPESVRNKMHSLKLNVSKMI